ncbi:MAG: Fe-S cluster assembly ATPase SufC [Candidatus Magasanikbacteria bacterium RIFCSPHIGHO2_01_FULL_33_34]|uniref:Fe-S cluster assembly ATPase SufC n=1 Tax=Candidatus Magasanikbacteria bacterium RIFCSPHIGHO2_01_FULL_33_34 TaxID=1798671 RepID=A0A1F6LHX9_9BACT|nr:MAG: Fe-S cluster assembly ATPase SufC [Candidatus Magasanikbacteria bacterium RIFCSPHIGHO2_01_FULL_33_34]OGH65198.1 MAG: Fe-S cluster assembly ATPase SufC [Candidatus Magasanikbacteria bacterium RIFCSPHIGHO2_02_FULL_33_17]OGH75257.1 MAG: Fe-S cluster assembly ATPase SufC [Candidatus Magasanikbacteria bacterium RIFCSPLOWO2_01_FULL_33_34]OGH82179.1 MAG: Fe-S cluster assembly ATPase SufC [Candidatus Magasanikbacteria bacterium RIFCSPLOWO2_12_FULL_34_7]
MRKLEIKNLFVEVDNKVVIKGLDLVINRGEIHVMMGPNGSGKSTLANALMGHPKYKITKGNIIIDGIDMTKKKSDSRAKAGLFLSMQNPPEVTGVSLNNFVRTSVESIKDEKINPVKFYRTLSDKLETMGINKDFLKRHVNVGFSGGEKKQMEIVQLLILNPNYVILDEIDSGLDVDALKKVSEGINNFFNKDKAILMITHYSRILDYIKPNFVHIMKNGKITKSGNEKMVKIIEKQGYSNK